MIDSERLRIRYRERERVSQNKSVKWQIVKERKCERTIRTCDEEKNKTKGKKGNRNKNINDEGMSWSSQSDMS